MGNSIAMLSENRSQSSYYSLFRRKYIKGKDNCWNNKGQQNKLLKHWRMREEEEKLKIKLTILIKYLHKCFEEYEEPRKKRKLK